MCAFIVVTSSFRFSTSLFNSPEESLSPFVLRLSFSNFRRITSFSNFNFSISCSFLSSSSLKFLTTKSSVLPGISETLWNLDSWPPSPFSWMLGTLRSPPSLSTFPGMLETLWVLLSLSTLTSLLVPGMFDTLCDWLLLSMVLSILCQKKF